MITAHILGFPRIGVGRELKRAVEAYWKGASDQATLLNVGAELRARHWRLQHEAGMDLIPVGDFSWYDHMLDMSALVGCIPPRFEWKGGTVDLDTYFRMARGAAPTGSATHACEMTKWFDTNYHFIVPEFHPDQRFAVSSTQLFDELSEAKASGLRAKPVLVGPITYLWLGKPKGAPFDKLTLLDKLLPVYRDVLTKLAQTGVEWVQMDEPALVLDLPPAWLEAYARAYAAFCDIPLKLLMATYFESLHRNTQVACGLPVAGLHIDLVRGADQLDAVLNQWPVDKVLSLGLIDGRNVWRADVDAALVKAQRAKAKFGDRAWIATSCSLLHVPADLAREDKLDAELKSWLAFAVQKMEELNVLKQALHQGEATVRPELDAARAAQALRRTSALIHNEAVKQRVVGLTPKHEGRASLFAVRRAKQQRLFNLPPFPTTTIGSFPQTAEIRAARRDFKAGRLTEQQYREKMRAEIAFAVRKQEAIGLDVLVHGEAERNDMVEYFGEQLDGFAITRNGWVQSYGSRCVKPPIIYGDVARPCAMTVEWATYAQSLTKKPMKGMLTGPVTILQWSFVRDDQPRAETTLQIALAIRDEVMDLERSGIKVIQIDEPAVREGLPLRKADHRAYLDWAVRAFKIAAGSVHDGTQIHTHMCYSEFNDIMDAVAAMDADVITIETSRSDMELLDAFVNFKYPNEIGPGVYDIHSPRVPATDEMVRLMRKAKSVLPPEHLWINPDCGLKTRGWPEVEQALINMVAAARILRAESLATVA